MSATHTLPTVTRAALPGGKYRYEVAGELHTAASGRLYTHASAYDYGDKGVAIFLHARADLAAKGSADANKYNRDRRIPGVIEIEEVAR